ncbi:50S ribosomal protein L3 [Candidatus Amesbacteria bacterium RIFOXYB1_FULL_47_13]|nr:MAG: 50S ribosomal protein L3 [Candidatus Amesbacteria bacterium RIFOXYB1_FULL_47_13]HBC72303.1 50S ribosomal protein L3 [Candidatus Amesbacteria bacterium]
MNTLFAIKTRMTGRYTPAGVRTGATILRVMPAVAADLRTKEKHGYEATRFKIQDLRFKKEIVREVRGGETPQAGMIVKVEEILKPGDTVRVTGISKGKGFAGGVKRHGFHGGPRTHGQSDRERAPGASGTGTTPGRVLKGKRMAGHMGNVKVSVSGLEVLEVNPDKDEVVVRGSVPGANKFTLLTVTKEV